MVSYDPRQMLTGQHIFSVPQAVRIKQEQREEFSLFKTVEILLHLNVDEEVMRQQIVRAFDFRYTEATQAINDVAHSLAVYGKYRDDGTGLPIEMPMHIFSCSYRYEWPQGYDLGSDNHETVAVYRAVDLLLYMKLAEDAILRELTWAFGLNDRQAADALMQIKKFRGLKEE